MGNVEETNASAVAVMVSVASCDIAEGFPADAEELLFPRSRKLAALPPTLRLAVSLDRPARVASCSRPLLLSVVVPRRKI